MKKAVRSIFKQTVMDVERSLREGEDNLDSEHSDNEDSDSLASLASNQQKRKTPCNYVISHDGNFKVLWDWGILLLVFFTAIQIPLYAAFTFKQSVIVDSNSRDNLTGLAIFSLIVDLLFIVDIFVNFRTTYVKSSSDEVVRQPRMLAIHYLKSWFVVDLLAAIPFDWIFYDKNNASNNTSTLIGLLKSARLLRLFRVARRIDRYSEYGMAVLFLLMSLFTLISHWLACVWNYIAQQEEGDENSWVRKMDEVLHAKEMFNGTVRMTQAERYIASLYFIISSLTSVGFGNVAATTKAEQIFSVILMLMGALMYACIFGNMVAIIQRLYSKTSHFHTQLNTVREFLKFYKIPEELRVSINNYVRREWAVSRGLDAEAVLHRFPDCIQADIIYELYREIFHSVRPLKEASLSCMRALAMKFKTITLQQNHHALRQGEEIHRLYILGKGSLEVLVDGELKALLTKYTIFGYDFLKEPLLPKSNANVRASCLVEIHYISKDDMLDVLNMYPRFAEHFRKTLKLGFDLNDENEEGFKQDVPKKEKYHIRTVAKNALSMPIMAKFARRKKSYQVRSKPTETQINENAVNANGRVNGSTHKLTVGIHDEIKDEVEPTKNLSEQGHRLGERSSPDVSHGSQVFFSDEHLPTIKVQSRESLASDCTLITLQSRMQSLERDMEYLRTDLDTKVTKILNILTNLQGKQKRSVSDTSTDSHEETDHSQPNLVEHHEDTVDTPV